MRAVAGPIGGADVFRERGADQQTMAVWLRAAGYSTGLFGKYINAYRDTESTKGPNGTYYVPPGWTRWRALAPERYGGKAGTDYAVVDEHGAAHDYSEHGSDAQYSWRRCWRSSTRSVSPPPSPNPGGDRRPQRARRARRPAAGVAATRFPLIEHWRATRSDLLDYGGQPQDDVVLNVDCAAGSPYSSVN